MKNRLKWFISDRDWEAMLGGASFLPDESNVESLEGFDMLSPLNLKIGQPVLVAVIEDNLANIAENIKQGFPVNEEIVAYRQEMERVLAWVRKTADTDGNLFMSIYPVDMNEEEIDEPVDMSEEAEMDDEDEPQSGF